MTEADGKHSEPTAELAAARAEIATLQEQLAETRREVVEAYDELDRTNQGVVALYAEIDDKNQQLREATAAKTRFLRSISHELRTPVNAILGLTALLLDSRQTERLSEEHTEQVQFVRTSAEDLLRLVEELMALARAESRRLDPVLREVSLSGLFEELRAVVEPLLRDEVSLQVEVVGADVVRTDPNLLRHVLRNLLSNAAKFTERGTVTLAAVVDPDAGSMEVRVTDTGVGIAPEDQKRIFEEFYQAPSPLQVGAKGTGLGLSFAQSVAKALGGDIQLESEPGVGSTFVLRLDSDESADEQEKQPDA